MKTVAAQEAKQRFSQLLDKAQREPVRIERHGRLVAVVVSAAEFERLELFDDAHWARRAMEAEQEGSIGVEEGERGSWPPCSMLRIEPHEAYRHLLRKLD